MLEWLKAILGESYTEDIDTKVAAEIGKNFVAKTDFNQVNTAMTATTPNTATNKACGANKKSFALVFMHSDVATGLENLNLVVVDDDMPATAGYFDATSSTTGALKIVANTETPGDGEIKLSFVTPYFGSKTLAADDYVLSGTQYITYALGKGTISYKDIGAKVPYAMARDEKTHGGEDTLYIRDRKCYHESRVDRLGYALALSKRGEGIAITEIFDFGSTFDCAFLDNSTLSFFNCSILLFTPLC